MSRPQQTQARATRTAAESAPKPPPEVLLVDTTGELALFYACADVVFVGKSLTCHGGQNPIEPAVCGRPVLTGPHMENFPVIMQDFLEAGALIQVADGEALTAAVRSLLKEEEQRRALGQRAAALVESKRGAVRATADLLQARWGS